METLGPAQAAPTTEQLIQICGKQIMNVMAQESSDENDPDRVWILRNIHRNYLYQRNLQNFAPSVYASVADFTGATPIVGDDVGTGMYDYSQNLYAGFCRKLEAVLGTRMPNAIAVPNNADDEDAIRATRSANTAALYIREKCDLQMLSLYLVFGLFNFGTNFWHIDWVVDEEKYGTKVIQVPGEPQQQPLGDGGFACPNCMGMQSADTPDNPPAACPDCQTPMGPEHFKPPTMASVPQMMTKSVPKGGLEITRHDGSEISVPLDSTCTETCDWLRWERESSKARLLKKWGDAARDGNDNTGPEEQTVSSQYGESIRSAMASPIGIVRAKRANRWTECDTWWVPAMYELVDEKPIRQMLQQNFPKGLRITSVRGRIVNLTEEKLSERWKEIKPEPSMRIMAEPLGNDWVQAQDIDTNTLNQCMETIDRSNEPGFIDPTRIDYDAYQNRRSEPGDKFPMLPRAGMSLGDSIYNPEPLTFSEQIQPFNQSRIAVAKNVSGLEDPIFGGGDAEEPTARQAELKKNAALMQLGVMWTMIGKSLEALYMKACKLLADNEDGVLEFAQKNQFGRYSKMAVIVDDLKNGKYHFEADEAIPMTWGQERDLLMWMLDKPADLLTAWGMNDPLNVPEQKRLLGMPGERTPHEDDREKGMDVIGQLLKDKPIPGQPGPPGPDGQPGPPGPPQPSIQPDWEDDHDFMSRLAKAYLIVNADLKQDNPDGYQNVVAWGQAQENMIPKPPPAEPKGSVSLSLKGPDLGDPAVAKALADANIVPEGSAPVQAVIPPPKIGANGAIMPPPGAIPQAPQGPPQ